MNTSIKNKHVHLLLFGLIVVLFGYVFTIGSDHRELNNTANFEGASMMAYAQLSSDITQRPTSDKPAKMQMRLRDIIHGIEFDPEISTTNIKILHDGVYFIMAAPQVGRLNPDKGDSACANFFFSINDEALGNSSATLCHSGPITKDVVIVQNIVTLYEGDELSVMISSSDPDLGIEALKPDDQPIVPSLIFSMFRIGDI